MKIGIVADKYKDPGFEILKKSSEILQNLGVETVYPDRRENKNYQDEYLDPEEDSLWEGVDIAISIGGDGTFLYTCREIYGKGIPIIGINRGSFGFLAEISPDDLEASLTKLAKGDYHKKSRMMLEVQVIDKDGQVIYKDYALNDAVLYRGDISRIIPCQLSINGAYIQTIPSDGIIVAGPSGSTGYAMSCGGPIVDSDLDLMLITPISPHTLQNRTYVVKPEDCIQVGIKIDYLYKPYLSVDGRMAVKLDPDHKICIQKASDDLEIIMLDEADFFDDLPQKLNARGIIG